MREIKSVIFDLDGVIVDTAKYHFLAWKSLAEELGFEFTLKDNEALKGVSRMRSLDILLEVGGVANLYGSDERERFAEKKNRIYLEYVMKMGKEELLPSVERFIIELKSAGINVVLGSASKNALLILERLGIKELFDVIVDGTDVSAAKPDPQVFILGAELTNVSPSESVVFEDAEAGVEAAHRAGMKCVGVGGSPSLLAADMRIEGFENFYLKDLLAICR